jgi:hypothetical protein
MLGEHSGEVLAELGYLPAAIGELVAAGVTRVAARMNDTTEAAE